MTKEIERGVPNMAYLCRLGSKKTISTSKNTPKSRPLTCVFHKIIERNVVDTKKKFP